MQKTALITGASKGIGLALAQIFLQHGFKVIGTCRAGAVREINHPDFEAMALDLSKTDSIKSFAKDFQDKNLRLDLLINNAGVGPDLDTDFPGEESFQETFDVNVSGAVFLTEQLCAYLNPKGKIIMISSKMGSISVCTLSDSVAYRMSKAALNMYAKILSNRYAGRFSVATVHPGWVRTTIAKSSVYGRLSPEESAGRIFTFVQSAFRNGIFWNVESNGEVDW